MLEANHSQVIIADLSLPQYETLKIYDQGVEIQLLTVYLKSEMPLRGELL